jgi:hypothetical protein
MNSLFPLLSDMYLDCSVIFSYNLSEVLTLVCYASFEKTSWNSPLSSTCVRSFQDCDLFCILRVEVGSIYTICKEMMLQKRVDDNVRCISLAFVAFASAVMAHAHLRKYIYITQ